MLQALLNVFLYIPRKIYRHFEYVKDLESKNAKLKEDVKNRDLLLKRIEHESNEGMKSNCLTHYSKLQKIKKLAQTFSPEQS